MKPLACPYCGSAAELKDSAHVYGRQGYGMAWVCARFPACDSYVGCHPGTSSALGRLANKELRRAKGRAHAAFDALWRKKLAREGGPKNKARGAGYAWLARQLGISAQDCHIGMFDVTMCNRVVEVCAPYVGRVQLRSE